ncbi:MAG TPA: hypothetical protein VFX59_02945 [Polyangiales bacterium]|nr:hypothetical protein [Polyangiales bacterium]
MAAGEVDPSRERDWLPWRGTYEDEFLIFDGGRVPYRYLERVAIMHHEGKLPLYRARELAALELAREPDAWVGKPTVDEVERPRCMERQGDRRCEGRVAIRRSMFGAGHHVCASCAARRLNYRCPRCGVDLKQGVKVSATRDGKSCCESCVDWVESRS